MLVLTRKVGEKIIIGDDISIELVRVDTKKQVRLGVNAPKGTKIDREEVRKLKEGNK